MKLSTTRLWQRWILANALGEMIGIGLTFGSIYASYAWLGEGQNTAAILGSTLLMVATGAIEGTILGLAQWTAMCFHFPAIQRRSWVLATLAGALVAWAFGSLPSTLMSLNAEAAQTSSPSQEPETWLMLLLAAGMGAILGIVLSFFQWLVLRRHVSQAWTWLPANSLAWLTGMPIIFWAIGVIQEGMQPLPAILTLVGCLFATGAVVGAIHGGFLVHFYRLQNHL
jgi:hypothetical protein